MRARRVTWQNRIKADVIEFLGDLPPVGPGLVNVEDWRPGPFQPQLPPVDEVPAPYVGASALHKGFREFGGVLRLTDR